MTATLKVIAAFTAWVISTAAVVALFLWMAGQFADLHRDLCDARVETIRAFRK